MRFCGDRSHDISVGRRVRTTQAAGEGRPARPDCAARICAAPPPTEVDGRRGLSGRASLRQRQIGVGWAALRDLPPAGRRAQRSRSPPSTRRSPRSARSPAPVPRRRRRDLLVAPVRRGDRRRSRSCWSRPDRRRAAPGRPGRAARRRDRAGRRGRRSARSGGRCCSRGDLKAVAPRRARRRRDRARRVRPRGRPAADTDARPGRADRRRGARPRPGMPAVVDAKLDGIRIQVHRSGDEVARVHPQPRRHHAAPARRRRRGARAAGHATSCSTARRSALDAAGRPRPFQETSSTGGAQSQTGRADALRPYFFDLLHLDGVDLIDEPGHRRWAALAAVVPAEMSWSRARRSRDAGEAQAGVRRGARGRPRGRRRQGGSTRPTTSAGGAARGSR